MNRIFGKISFHTITWELKPKIPITMSFSSEKMRSTHVKIYENANQENLLGEALREKLQIRLYSILACFIRFTFKKICFEKILYIKFFSRDFSIFFLCKCSSEKNYVFCVFINFDVRLSRFTPAFWWCVCLFPKKIRVWLIRWNRGFLRFFYCMLQVMCVCFWYAYALMLIVCLKPYILSFALS